VILSADVPQFMPCLGYFDRMDRSDVFVLLEDDPVPREGWHNRTRIRSADEAQVLTVPVRPRPSQALARVEVADQLWRHNHLLAIERAYAGADRFGEATDLLRAVYEQPWRMLAPLNTFCVRSLASRFGIRARIRVSSEFERLADTDPESRLLDLCRRLGADTALVPSSLRDAIDPARWEREDLGLVLWDFYHPTYPQAQGRFIPGLSALDLLLNCGAEGFDTVRRARKRAA
jgi:hypothetical protein